jgi:hypothetical protein
MVMAEHIHAREQAKQIAFFVRMGMSRVAWR